jgi:hypothetical protein
MILPTQPPGYNARVTRAGKSDSTLEPLIPLLVPQNSIRTRLGEAFLIDRLVDGTRKLSDKRDGTVKTLWRLCEEEGGRGAPSSNELLSHCFQERMKPEIVKIDKRSSWGEPSTSHDQQLLLISEGFSRITG